MGVRGAPWGSGVTHGDQGVTHGGHGGPFFSGEMINQMTNLLRIEKMGVTHEKMGIWPEKQQNSFWGQIPIFSPTTSLFFFEEKIKIRKQINSGKEMIGIWPNKPYLNEAEYWFRLWWVEKRLDFLKFVKQLRSETLQFWGQMPVSLKIDIHISEWICYLMGTLGEK